MLNLIERARKAAGLSIQALADRARTSRPTLSAYIHGRVQPQLDTLERVLDATGHELELAAVPSFRVVPGRGGQIYHAPDRLWRLPIDEAFRRYTPPLHVEWSPGGRTYDLANRHDRRVAYESLLREGTPDDLRTTVDGALLIDLWPEFVLPPQLANAWSQLFPRAPVQAHAA